MDFIDQQIQGLLQLALTAPPARAAKLYADIAKLLELKEAQAQG